MTERIGIVWNPSKVSEGDLTDAWERANDQSEVRWYETSPDDPGIGATEQAIADGCTVVVAAGGDGTVRACADGLYRHGAGAPEFGIVPLGTGNLLARNLEIPLADPTAALRRVLTAAAQPLDLGRATVERAGGSNDADRSDAHQAEQHCFTVMAGFGIDAQMIVETNDELKARAGWIAYLESLGRATAGTEMVDIELDIDGARSHDRAHTVLIANCGKLQGGFALLPEARPDDGELDMLVLRADSAGEWLETVKNVVWDNGIRRALHGGATVSSESTAHQRAKRVRARLERPLEFEVDGDPLGEVVAIEVETLPGALRVR